MLKTGSSRTALIFLILAMAVLTFVLLKFSAQQTEPEAQPITVSSSSSSVASSPAVVGTAESSSLPSPAASSSSSVPVATNLTQLGNYTNTQPVPEAIEVDIPQPSTHDHVQGDTEAPVRAIMYLDFEGPYNRLAYSAVQGLLATNESKVAIVFRHFPLVENPLSHLAAEASECVFAQKGEEAFWKFADALYATTPLTERIIGQAAASLGTDKKKFEACVNDGEQRERVLADKRSGYQDANVRVIPSVFFLNLKSGEVRMVTGATGTKFLQAVLDEELRMEN